MATVPLPPNFQWTREPDPEWVRQLEAVSPVNDMVSHLKIVWEAGDPWEPGQRWCLYQMKPRWAVHPDIVEELDGPDPRSVNYFDGVLGEFQCFTLVTKVQWDLWRATNRRFHGTPFWTIQGDRGGHKDKRMGFSPDEQRICRMRNWPSEPPAIGDLPYAAFDGRVLAQIERLDKLLTVRGNLAEFKKKHSTEYAKHKAENEQQFRKQLVEWLGEQVAPEADMIAWAAKREGVEAGGQVDHDFAHVAEASEQQFIETGEVPHQSTIARKPRIYLSGKMPDVSS